MSPSAGLAIVTLLVQTSPVAAVYQRQLSLPSFPPGSVNDYQQKLGSKRAHDGMQ